MSEAVASFPPPGGSSAGGGRGRRNPNHHQRPAAAALPPSRSSRRPSPFPFSPSGFRKYFCVRVFVVFYPLAIREGKWRALDLEQPAKATRGGGWGRRRCECVTSWSEIGALVIISPVVAIPSTRSRAAWFETGGPSLLPNFSIIFITLFL